MKPREKNIDVSKIFSVFLEVLQNTKTFLKLTCQELFFSYTMSHVH